jgi:hypothetical protein
MSPKTAIRSNPQKAPKKPSNSPSKRKIQKLLENLNPYFRYMYDGNLADLSFYIQWYQDRLHEKPEHSEQLTILIALRRERDPRYPPRFTIKYRPEVMWTPPPASVPPNIVLPSVPPSLDAALTRFISAKAGRSSEGFRSLADICLGTIERHGGDEAIEALGDERRPFNVPFVQKRKEYMDAMSDLNGYKP